MEKTTTSSGSKVKGSRNLSSDEYRVLAEHAKTKEAADRKNGRAQKAKRLAGVPDRRWATDDNRKIADKQNRVVSGPTEPQNSRPSRDEMWEFKREGMIQARNRRRRLPWYFPLGALAAGLAGEGVSALFATASVPSSIVAAVFAGIPALAAGGAVIRSERDYHQQLQLVGRRREQGDTDASLEPTHRRWIPELLLGGAGSAGLTYWIALTGLSWLIVLTALGGTVLLGLRWWKANPIGPGVPPLEPPKPAKEPTPKPVVTAAPIDEYAQAWRRNLTDFGQLTNRTDNDNITQYDVELPPGKTTTPTVLRSVLTIAGALGLDPQQVIPEPPRKNEDGFRPANRARLTIIRRDVATGIRYWTKPNVEMATNGTAAVLVNLARFRDGQGEAQCVMWNRDGMVPTTIYGGTGSGKSAAVNGLTVGALSTGLLNSIYVDLKGNSSGALRSRARIVVVGRDALDAIRKLMQLLTDTRLRHDPRDKQFPTAERPGWFVFIEEIAKGIKGDARFALQMENMATTVRSLGIWLVSTAHDMHSSAWGGTNARAAFSKQAFVFYMNTDSDSLINGLTYRASQLPTYDEEEAAVGQGAQPIPGFGVGANTYRANVPARWDWLPSDDDPVDEEPPWRATAAWDEFVREPGLTQYEYDALVDALGPPNPDGRWIIGIGGTHQFKDDTKNVSSGGQRPVRTGGFEGYAKPQPTPADGLTDTNRRVLQIIEGGTTRTAEILEALDKMGRSTVHKALSELVGANQIHRVAGNVGIYAVGPDPNADIANDEQED